jgi:hypothetical protein
VKPPKSNDRVHEHGPECACEWCEYEVLPRYACGVGG